MKILSCLIIIMVFLSACVRRSNEIISVVEEVMPIAGECLEEEILESLVLDLQKTGTVVEVVFDSSTEIGFDIPEIRRYTIPSGEFRSLCCDSSFLVDTFHMEFLPREGTVGARFPERIRRMSESSGLFILHFDNQPLRMALNPDMPELKEYSFVVKQIYDSNIFEITVTGQVPDLFMRTLNSKKFRLVDEFKFSPTHIVVGADGWGCTGFPYVRLYENDNIKSPFWYLNMSPARSVHFVELIELGRDDGDIQLARIRQLNIWWPPSNFDYGWVNYEHLREK